MIKAWNHFKTITVHKYLVAQGCFRLGLYLQGIFHDLSKYSPREFIVGAKYYQGDRSPNNAEREDKGYSDAWLHHKGRNRHHFEYWIDYSLKDAPGIMSPVPMPDRYIVEMFLDRVAACKVYEGKNYTDASPLKYYNRGTVRAPLHPDTRRKLELLLKMLARRGEKETFASIRRMMKKSRRNKKDHAQAGDLRHKIP